MRLRDYERFAATMLTEAGVDSPGLCARLLLAHVAQLDDLAYILAQNTTLDKSREARFYSLLSRRKLGEPLAYILGEKEFYSRLFKLSPAVLIPRPETELLVETVLSLCPSPQLQFADAGCGSGCIGLTLLAERAGWEGLLLDNSVHALAVAKNNGSLLRIEASYLRADMRELPFGAQSLDLLVANPPYINPEKASEVMPQVLAWEPHSALFSPEDGLGHCQYLINQAQRILRKNGWLVLEHGAEQGPAVRDFMRKAHLENINDIPDLAGLPRCAYAQKL